MKGNLQGNPKSEGRNPKAGRKSEIRNPKSEGNPKAEGRNPKAEARRPSSQSFRASALRPMLTPRALPCHAATAPNERAAADFGLRISDFGFPSDFGFRGFGFQISDFGFRPSPFALLTFVAVARLRAATNVTDAIPPLRPPRGELPPGFWEEHGALTVAGALLALVLLGVAGWLLTRRKPVAGPAPDTLARRALEPLRRQPEGGAVLSRVSQTLRLYLTAAFGLPPEELTSTEFCRLLRENPGVGPELSAGIGEFLRRCEERKFAPLDPQPALGAVQRAFEFIEAAERRLAQLRQAAPGGPFPGGKGGA